MRRHFRCEAGVGGALAFLCSADVSASIYPGRDGEGFRFLNNFELYVQGLRTEGLRLIVYYWGSAAYVPVSAGIGF